MRSSASIVSYDRMVVAVAVAAAAAVVLDNVIGMLLALHNVIGILLALHCVRMSAKVALLCRLKRTNPCSAPLAVHSIRLRQS